MFGKKKSATNDTKIQHDIDGAISRLRSLPIELIDINDEFANNEKAKLLVDRFFRDFAFLETIVRQNLSQETV